MQLPIAVPLKASRLLAALLAAAHGVAAGAVLSTTLPWPLRMLLLALLAVALPWSILRQQRQPIARLHLGSKGEIEVEPKVGARGTAALLPGTLVLPGLVLLALHWDGRRHALVILPDAMAPDAYRQLRVWLKWRASFG